MDLGDAISIIRKRKRITQKELAGKCNLSVAALSNIEKGKIIPSHQTIEALAGEMGIQTADLIMMTLAEANADLIKTSLFKKVLSLLKT